MLKCSVSTKWLAAALLVAAISVATGIRRGETADAAGQGAAAAEAKTQKVDPVAANGAIFKNWSKPDVALVFSGEQNGYLEPCGCAGLENQKGGLKRRFTFLKQLREKGWNVVAMDLGGQEIRTGVQALRKVNFAYNALMRMGYAAVGFGPGELKLGTDLTVLLLDMDQKTSPLVSANVSLDNFNSDSNNLYKIVE